MKIELISSLLFAIAIAQASAEDELSMLDDSGNPVSLQYNESSSEASEDMAVSTVSSDHVKFYLYSRTSTEGVELFVDDEETLSKSSFNTNLETKIITHGWLNSISSDACLLIKNAYLEKGDYNVILIDWSSMTMGLYGYASSNVLGVAKYVAKMIDFLANNGMDLSITTMVGHSLGAHVVGIAGNVCNGTVDDVVGLDPALPFFRYKKAGERISSGDANSVEIVHTSGGTLGFYDPLGTVDFYVNGGKKQPGCLIDFGFSCSHGRSFRLFAESLVTEIGFYGKKCSSDSIAVKTCIGVIGKMGGLNYSLAGSGSYYVPTKDSSPYAEGETSV